MGKVILSTDKLCKTFSNEGVQQHVLKNLDLEIYDGDFTIIMGSSGAGKSTLMYALSGMDKPTLGKINFNGQDIAEYSDEKLALFRRKNCGFVFQQVYLLDKMSLMDNVLASGLLVERNKKKLICKAKELFAEVNISQSTWKKFSSQISGGEAQRAGIVRALINKPTIVFADEPTGALNSDNSKAVLDVLSKFNEDGQNIVMVTHDIKSALRGNRIIYLEDGAIKGECILGRYSKGDSKRYEALNNFLIRMGW